MVKLSEDNFIVYAMNHYDKVSIVSVEEFEEDLLRFKYLKKLFNRYYEKNDLNERLILNHLIVLYNVFGNHATNMLFFKLPKEQWPVLITFLLYLNRLPEELPEYNFKSSKVNIDELVVKRLREL